jgi:hypothetical protein
LTITLTFNVAGRHLCVDDGVVAVANFYHIEVVVRHRDVILELKYLTRGHLSILTSLLISFLNPV